MPPAGPRSGGRASVGAMLRAAREGLGESVHDVARNLRIRRIYISAIEESEYDKLPGSAYAIGFVRSYSEYLGLDSDDLVRRFKNENLVDAPHTNEQLSFPATKSDRHIPGLGYIATAVVLALVAYGGWYAYNEDFWGLGGLVSGPGTEQTTIGDSQVSQNLFIPGPSDRSPGQGNLPEASNTFAPASPSPQPAPELPVASPESPLAPPALPGDNAVAAAPQSDPMPDVTSLVNNLGSTTEPAPAAPVATQPGGSGLAAPQGRIMLRARADVWFTVRDAAADRLEVAKLLSKGETYVVPDKPNLVLLIGNAGLMDIAVGNQQIAPLGDDGDVVRDVKLDPNALLNGTAMQ